METSWYRRAAYRIYGTIRRERSVNAQVQVCLNVVKQQENRDCKYNKLIEEVVEQASCRLQAALRGELTRDL